MRRYPSKTVLTLLLTALLCVAQSWIPGWKRYRFFDSAAVVRAFHPGWDSPTSSPPVLAGAGNPAEPRPAATTPPSGARTPRAVEIEDPTGAMRPFYEKLRRREQGENLTLNILHYGESPVSADLVTADIRELLQARFGDAGHGFCLLVKPWAWYEHRRIAISGTGWTIERVTNSAAPDGRYGLGGVTFAGGAGAHAELRLAAPGASVARIHFLRQPQGGSFRVTAAGGAPVEIAASANETADSVASVPLLPEAKQVRLDVVSGTVRVFGWELRSTSPGVVYSALGLNGAFIDVLGRRYRSGHLESVWREERPDLIVLNYGTNGLIGEKMADVWFLGEVRHALKRAKGAAPAGAPVLVMSPMDKGWRDDTGEITTSEGYQQMVRLLQQASLEEGVPFYNTFEAMGGPGSMGRWYHRDPPLVGGDLIHPTTGGGRIVAKLFVDALLRGYARYKPGGGVRP